MKNSDLNFSKVPPQAKDLEEFVLGAIMLDQDAIDRVIPILSPESFYVDAHRKIFKVMIDISKRNLKIDILTVVQELKSLGILEEVGNAYFVMGLTNKVTSSVNIENHCRIIIQQFLKRKLIEVGAEILQNAYDESTDSFELMGKIQQSLSAIDSHTTIGDVVGMDTALVKTMLQIEEWRKSGSSCTGVPSGFKKLDHLTRGWQPGDLIIIAARPSVGKTAFTLALADNAATENFPVLLFSYEMKFLYLILRMLSFKSKINLHRIQTGRLDDEQMESLHRDGITELSKLPIFFDDSPGLNMMALKSKARKAKKKHGIKLIAVDYMQLIKSDEKNPNREREVALLARDLKNLAQELEVPVIALSQINREVEKRDNRKPQLSDLRESGAIEQDADLVIFLWGPSDEEITKDSSLANKRYARIAKQRNGMLGTFDFEFDKGIQFWQQLESIKKTNADQPNGKWKPALIDYSQSAGKEDDYVESGL